MKYFIKGVLFSFIVLSLLKLATASSFAAKPNSEPSQVYQYQNEIKFSSGDLVVISSIISGTHTTPNKKASVKTSMVETLPQIASFIKLETQRRQLDTRPGNAEEGSDDNNGLYRTAPQIAALGPGAGSYLGYATPVHSTIWNFISRYNKRLTPPQVSQISGHILEMSSLFQVDPQLVTGVLAVESSFNPYAISTTGAMGLGQLKPDTAEWLGIQDPFDPRQNVYASTKYLRFLLDKYRGNVQYALAAYYKGQGAVDRTGLDNNSISYVNRISHVIGQM